MVCVRPLSQRPWLPHTCAIQCSVFGVQGTGFRVQGSGFGVWSSGGSWAKTGASIVNLRLFQADATMTVERSWEGAVGNSDPGTSYRNQAKVGTTYTYTASVGTTYTNIARVGSKYTHAARLGTLAVYVYAVGPLAVYVYVPGCIRIKTRGQGRTVADDCDGRAGVDAVVARIHVCYQQL